MINKRPSRMSTTELRDSIQREQELLRRKHQQLTEQALEAVLTLLKTKYPEVTFADIAEYKRLKDFEEVYEKQKELDMMRVKAKRDLRGR